MDSSLHVPSNFFHYTHKYVAGNVEDLSEARVICLGETHFDAHALVRNAFLINQWYGKGDLVLTEYPPLEQNQNGLNSQSIFLNKGLRIDTWDTFAKREEIYTLNPKMEEVIQKITALEALIHDDLWPEQVLATLRFFPPEEKKKGKAVAWQEIPAIERGPLTNRLIQVVLQHFDKQVNATLFKTCITRNENLVDKVHKSLQTHKKIFVVAGRSHFFPTEDYVQKEASEVVKQGLKSTSYLMLDPREDSLGLSCCLEGLKLQLGGAFIEGDASKPWILLEWGDEDLPMEETPGCFQKIYDFFRQVWTGETVAPEEEHELWGEDQKFGDLQARLSKIELSVQTRRVAPLPWEKKQH